MTPTFSVLVPTIGRSSLEATVRSYLAQERIWGDELHVLIDTHGRAISGTCRSMIARQAPTWPDGVYVDEYDAGERETWLGVAQMNRRWRSGRVTGSHVLILGDDDCYTPAAFATLRSICGAEPDRPVLFQFVAPWREVLWDRPRLRKSRISGCCIAVPRAWMVEHPTGHYVEHDYDWIVGIVDRARAAGHEPIWLAEVFVVARPAADTAARWPTAGAALEVAR